jgi:rhamnosyltransferase
VVIPTLDAGRAFGTVLHRLSKQDLQPLEILIVDGGSQDGTRHIVSQFPLARFVEAGVAPGPRAWNRACREARGEVVVFLTQDALPSDDSWLRQLVSPFAEPAVGGVYGRLLCPGQPLTEYRLARRYPDRERRRRARFGDQLNLDGIQFCASNAALRASVWQGIRFNEHLPVAADREWARQAMLASYTIVYQPAARVDRTLTPSLPLAFHDALLAGWTSEYLGGEAGTLRSDPPHFMRRAAWHLLRRFRVDQLPYLVLEDMALRYGYGVGERLHEAAPSIRRRVAPEIANEAPRRYLTEYEQIA